jgi:AraC-like DNA-binding protein
MVRLAQIPVADPGNLRPGVRFLRDAGVPYAADLDAAHVPIETVEIGRGKISKLQLFEVLKRWQRRCSEDFGYLAGSYFTPSLMGGAGRLMMEAPTLAAAIERFNEHLHAWVSDNSITAEQSGDRAFLRIATRDGLDLDRAVANQIQVQAMVNIVRLAGGPNWTPKRVWVEVPPHTFHERTGVLWDAEVVFDAVDTTVEFPARFLAMPPARVARPLDAPLPSPIEDSTARRLRHIVDACLGFSAGSEAVVLPPPSISRAAHLVGWSPRTLQRRLAEEGAVYRRIVADARFDRARTILQREAVPASELAMLLGYSSKSVFLRAFRRYTGMTPSEYRREFIAGN